MMLHRRHSALGWLVLMLALGLGGCGFKLRGYAPVPASQQALQTLQFQAADAYSELARQLQRSLKGAGITLDDQAPYRLRLLDEAYKRQATTFSGSANVEEYELTGTARFMLVDAEGNSVLGPESVNALRFYQYDPDNPVGKSEEEALLREELQQDLARRIVQRIQSLTPAALQAAEAASQNDPATTDGTDEDISR